MLEILLALCATVNRVVEISKRSLAQTSLSAETRSVLVLAIQLIAGIFAVGLAGVNLLADTPAPELIGLIVTGLVVGLGSEAVHVVVSLVKALAPNPAPAETAPVPDASEVPRPPSSAAIMSKLN